MDSNQVTGHFVLVSRHTNPEYAKRTMVSEAALTVREPVKGRIFFDNVSDQKWRRNFSPYKVEFPPIFAYHLSDVHVGGEFVAFKENKLYADTSLGANLSRNLDYVSQTLEPRAQIFRNQNPVDQFWQNTVLLMHNEGGGTWGHYLAQNLPRALLFLKMFPYGKLAIPEPYLSRNNSFGEVLFIYGIQPDQLIGLKKNEVYRFKELIILDFLFYLGKIHPLAIELLDLKKENVKPSGLTYISRSAGNRLIENRIEIEQVMHEKNAKILVQKNSVDQQIEAWKGTSAVVGTLGSDLTNILFGQPGTKILSLSPHWFGDNFFFELAIAKGMQWNEIRSGLPGQQVDTTAPNHRMNFYVDIDVLNKSLDLVMAS